MYERNDEYGLSKEVRSTERLDRGCGRRHLKFNDGERAIILGTLQSRAAPFK